MKQLRELFAIFAIMAAGVALTGCGSDDDGGGGGGGGATAPATMGAFEANGGVWYLTPGTGDNAGRTYAVTFSGGNYSVTFPDETQATTGTYTYTVDTNNPHRANLRINEPDGVTEAVLDFTAENAGTYTATFTPSGGGQPETESGTFGRTNPNPGGGDPTNTNQNPNPTNTNTNPNPSGFTVAGRAVQLQFASTGGRELLTFSPASQAGTGTFTSDYNDGSGAQYAGTYTIQNSSATEQTVNIQFDTPTAAANDAYNFTFTSASANGGTFQGTAVIGGQSSAESGSWTFQP